MILLVVIKCSPPFLLHSNLACETDLMIDHGGCASWLVCAETVLVIAALDIQLMLVVPTFLVGWAAAIFFKGVA